MKADGSTQTEVLWPEVREMLAFKRDLFAVDRVCLAFSLGDNTALEINEEMIGWDGLVEKLPEYLSGCTSFENWFNQVAFPAFATNTAKTYARVNPL